MGHPALDLTSKTAVVIGGTSGIGLALAEGLAQAGANVVATGRRTELVRSAADKIEKIGRRSLVITTDVTDRASLEALDHSVCAEFGSVDILVNCAGTTKRTPTLEITESEWNSIIAINLTGTLQSCQVFGRKMVERKYGRIINIASIAGKEGNPNMTGYSATKAAVIGFTKSLAKEVALDGICVNSVAPAVIRTKILDQLTAAQVDYMTERIPMRRTGTTEEIAAVVHFLASPDCSFVTGQCYDASGGRATY